MCVIRGCSFSRVKQFGGEESKKLAQFTVCNQERLNAWQDSINELAETPQNLKKGDRICEFHFEDKLIIRDTRLGKSFLKPQAIPTLFPSDARKFVRCHEVYRVNEPICSLHVGYKFADYVKKEETVVDNDKEIAENVEQRKSVFQNYEILDNCNSESGSEELNNGGDGNHKEFSTEYLSIFDNDISIENQSSEWIAYVHKDKIMWKYKNYPLEAEKQVVLSSNLQVDIYLQSRKVSIPSCEQIRNSDDMLNVLKEVADIIPCEEAGRPSSSKNCVGYVHKKICYKNGCQSTRCLQCTKHRRYLRQNYQEKSMLKKLKEKLDKKNKLCMALQASRRRLLKRQFMFGRLKLELKTLQKKYDKLVKQREIPVKDR